MKKISQYMDLPFNFIQVEGQWLLEHKYNWEKVHGKIAKGFCLFFKDRNQLNCDLSNLELITLSENRRRILEDDSVPFIAISIKAKQANALKRQKAKEARNEKRKLEYQEFLKKQKQMKFKKKMSSHKSAIAKRMDEEWLSPPKIKKNVIQGEMVQLKPGLMVELKPGKTIEQLKAKYGVK